MILWFLRDFLGFQLIFRQGITLGCNEPNDFRYYVTVFKDNSLKCEVIQNNTRIIEF